MPHVAPGHRSPPGARCVPGPCSRLLMVVERRSAVILPWVLITRSAITAAPSSPLCSTTTCPNLHGGDGPGCEQDPRSQQTPRRASSREYAGSPSLRAPGPLVRFHFAAFDGQRTGPRRKSEWVPSGQSRRSGASRGRCDPACNPRPSGSRRGEAPRARVTVHPSRPWKDRPGECGEAVRGVEWRRRARVSRCRQWVASTGRRPLAAGALRAG